MVWFDGFRGLMSRVSKSFCKDAGCVESLNDESLTKELQSFLWAQDFRVKKRIAFETFQSGGFVRVVRAWGCNYFIVQNSY